jgi:hypothetical protein
MVRLVMLKSMINLNVRKYLSKVVFIVMMVSVLSAIIPYSVTFMMEQGVVRFFVTGILSVIFVVISVYLVGLSAKEKTFIVEKIKEIITKKIKKSNK